MSAISSSTVVSAVEALATKPSKLVIVDTILFRRAGDAMECCLDFIDTHQGILAIKRGGESIEPMVLHAKLAAIDSITILSRWIPPLEALFLEPIEIKWKKGEARKRSEREQTDIVRVQACFTHKALLNCVRGHGQHIKLPTSKTS